MSKSSRPIRRLKGRRFRKRYNRSLSRALTSGAAVLPPPLSVITSFVGRPSVFRAASSRYRRRVVLVPSFPLPERVFMQSSAQSLQTSKPSCAELLAVLAQFAELLPSDAQPSFRETLEGLSQLCEKAEQRRERDKQTLRFVQFALENLRVDAKYLAFDVEATRRENVRLSRLLETFLNNER